MSAPTLRRLVRVELRKATDTRAGRWLLIMIGLLGAAVVVLLLLAGKPAELNFGAFLFTAQLPIGIMLPVLGILAVTGEWSQRTALTTFTLVPRRSRIVAAKIIALVVIALAAVAASVAAAATGNLIAGGMPDTDARWGPASNLGYVALFQVLCLLVGIGLGMLLLSAPQAIVAYLVLPTLVSGLASVVDRLKLPAQWLDLTSTTTHLLGDDLTGRIWAQIATSFAVWGLLPLLVGAGRIQRREVQ